MAATLTPEEEILKELEGKAAAPPPSDSAAAEQALLNEGINPQIDLDNAVPAGTYISKIIEVVVKKSEKRQERDPVTQIVSEKGGNLYLNLKLEIVEGENAGRFVWDMVMLTGKGANRLALLASKLGFYDADLKCLKGFEQNPPTAGMIKARILDQVVGIETEIEKGREWNGKKQPDRARVVYQGYFTPDQPETAATAPAWE